MPDIDPFKPMVYEAPPRYYEPKEYKKLKKKFDYDKEQAEEYAEAMTELNALKARVVQLQSLLAENADELEKFMWTTSNGVVKAHHQIDDDHLKNILQHLLDTGRKPSKALAAEMESRGMQVPAYSTKYILDLLSDEEMEDMRNDGYY